MGKTEIPSGCTTKERVCVCVRVNRRGWRKQRNLFCSSVSENDRESSEQERSRYFCLIRVTVRKHCHTLCSRLSRCRGGSGEDSPIGEVSGVKIGWSVWGCAMAG